MGTNHSERIPLEVFIVSSYSISIKTKKQLTLKKVVNGTLFGLALLFATGRMVIRFHSQRKLNPDDFGLIFACSTFIASQVLLHIFKIENIYWTSAVIFDHNPQTLTSIIEDPEAFLHRRLRIRRLEITCVMLTWTSIFAVKISFLLFFHQMITRVRKLIVAWRVIFGITILFWPFCTFGVFMTCPHFGPDACKSALLPSPGPTFCWLQHLTNRSELCTRSRVNSKPFFEHHRSCSWYCVRLAP